MTWNIDIERIAGILDGSATIAPGVNVVRGSNWQGKSSFIEAIKTALGTSTELTEGAESGTVHLETPTGVYDVALTRENGTVARRGEPYLSDEYDVTRAELFACLDERNEVRRAVRAGENLEDVLLRPLDFQNIDAQIETLQREREQIETELTQAREAKKRIPSVQEKVTRLENEIEDLQAKRETIDSEAGSDDSSESVRRQLSQARTEQNQAQNRVERLEQSIERTEQRLSERQDDLDALEIPEYNDVADKLSEARESLSQVERDAEVLQSVYSATEMVLSEDRLDLLTEVERDIDEDTVACWTCGSETTRADLADRLDALGSELTALRAQKETYRDTVEELETQREEISQARQRKADLEEDIAELKTTLADRKQSLDAARSRLEKAQGDVERLSDTLMRPWRNFRMSKVRSSTARPNSKTPPTNWRNSKRERPASTRSKPTSNPFVTTSRNSGAEKTDSSVRHGKRSIRRCRTSFPDLGRGSKRLDSPLTSILWSLATVRKRA